jgi:hypothetical protein
MAAAMSGEAWELRQFAEARSAAVCCLSNGGDGLIGRGHYQLPRGIRFRDQGDELLIPITANRLWC